jgi:hypothetical protein
MQNVGLKMKIEHITVLERVAELIAAGDNREAYDALGDFLRDTGDGLRSYDMQVKICGAWGKSANQITQSKQKKTKKVAS